MAKPISEEELQLKKRARRRLVGAIALVAAVAAVLPMVLDSEPKPTSREVSIQIPPPDAKGGPAPKSEKAPAPKAEAKAPEPPALAPPPEKVPPKAVEPPPAKAAEKAPDKAPEKAPPAAVPDKALAKAIERVTERGTERAGEKAPEKIADKAPDKSTAPKAGPGAFFIQVMALSEAEKARQVQQKMAGAGVRAYTEEVTAGAGKVTRVRAGPFATREEAEKAREKLQSIGLEGKVAAY